MLIVPPGSGIVHQVNLEYLARVVFNDGGLLYPDSLVGTDSHTTMINGLGVVGWGKYSTQIYTGIMCWFDYFEISKSIPCWWVVSNRLWWRGVYLNYIVRERNVTIHLSYNAFENYILLYHCCGGLGNLILIFLLYRIYIEFSYCISILSHDILLWRCWRYWGRGCDVGSGYLHGAAGGCRLQTDRKGRPTGDLHRCCPHCNQGNPLSVCYLDA